MGLERVATSSGVAAWIVGRGTPVVVLHGLSIDHRGIAGSLEPVFDRVDGFKRLYLDIPGMGESPRTEQATADALVAAIDEVVAELVGSRPFLLLGQSYGAYLARGVASGRGGQVLGLAQIVPVVEPTPAERILPDPVKLVVDDESMSALPQPFLDGFRPLMVVESPEIAAALARDIVPALAIADHEFIAELQEAGYGLSLAEPGSAPDGPGLVVCGRYDAVVGYEQAAALAAASPNTTLAVLDGAGHMAELERASVVAALVEDWLRRCRLGREVG